MASGRYFYLVWVLVAVSTAAYGSPVYQVDAYEYPPSDYNPLQPFFLQYEDTSGNGLFELSELKAFSGYSITYADGSSSKYDVIEYVPPISLLSSQSGNCTALCNYWHFSDPVNFTGIYVPVSRYAYQVSSVPVPVGSDPSNPILPVVQQDGWQFSFNVDPNQIYYIDPTVAIGYDFFVDSGPAILSALLPNVGDALFDICLWNGSTWGSCSAASSGVPFLFGGMGVDRFRVLGIETSASLDPSDTTAFVTGLTFNGSGDIELRQVPITQNVAEPSTFLLWAVGFPILCKRRKATNIVV